MNTHERPQSDVTSTKAAWEERGTSEAPAACVETPSGKRHQALQRKLNQRPAVQSLLQRQQDVSQSPRVVAREAQASALQARHATPAATAGSAPVVQRYTVEDGYRVSEHHTLAVPEQNESKDFYATPAEINRSNLILEAIQSRVELQAGPAAPEPLADMRAVTPVPRNPQQPLFDVNECIDVADRVTNSGQTHAIYQPGEGGVPLLRQQSPYPAVVEQLNVIARHLADNPDVTPQTLVTDQNAISDENEDAARLQFTFGGVDIRTDRLTDASTALAPVIPVRELRIALLREIFAGAYERQPEVQQRLAGTLGAFLAQHAQDGAREIDEWAELLQDSFDTHLRQARDDATARYMDQYADVTDARSRQVGVNAHANPEPGESYAIVGSRDRTPEEMQLWSFHFAAVIARDGADTVTLENYNRNGAEGANQQWYFDMHGPQQSFHEKHRHTVAGALTLRMGAPATDELRTRTLMGLPQPVSEEVAARIEQARTRAELAAIHADVMSATPEQDVDTL
ncbi:hypothetical protein [Myxococcus eversor]|uniref:hypothetical protein n=1 Tax=Myxococcus eversor TaxID=2709661 RepID=UPI0013D443F5|nr:hypothetical protein [Myxococcus eversor]